MSYSTPTAATQTISRKTLPTRHTPQWVRTGVAAMDTRNTTGKVITGRLPIGIFPGEIITETERQELLRRLRNLPIRKYDNTIETENVSVQGLTFVDSPTLNNYLLAVQDDDFDRLTAPLLNRVINKFIRFGFEVKPLRDSLTLLPYHAKVCREISVPDGCCTSTGNECTVLHCDDILRDGSTKPDFRIPEGLDGMNYHQFSVCILLDDGGYRPDDIIVYEKQYSREMESDFYGDGGWRYDAGKLGACRSQSYTPELRKCYMFSSINFHDVRGGHTRSKRLNFSVFFIYVPGTNTLYYYN